MQVDGLACEFNIDPVTNVDDFIRNINAVKRQLTEMVQKHNPDLILVAKPTAKFDKRYFNKVPESQKELGCDPDYDAMTGLVNPRPDPGDRPVRTGGGHIHIGWGSGFSTEDAAHFNDCRVVVKSLYQSGLKRDYLWDDDNQRRKLYGSSYSFRPKSFGVEYRYLSNAWVENEEAIRYIFSITENVMKGLDATYNEELKKVQNYYKSQVPVPEKLYTDFTSGSRARAYESKTSNLHVASL